MISIRTNVDSLNAQQNLNINREFQSKTIQQLTSGYRINSSGDDAAGLAIANGLRSNITELTQGVSNANDGVGQLQIIDGGLSNIGTILDRMKTLATQSASGTFTGDRSTLNQEYQQLISEVTRQASNINLNSGGSLNQVLNAYIGGANSTATASVSIDLSGAKNAVDATSLGLSLTNVLAGNQTGFSTNTTVLTAGGATFVGTGSNETFAVNYIDASGNAQSKALTVAAQAGGSTLNQVLSSLNSQLSGTGITASTDTNGKLQFNGTTAFSVNAGSVAGVTNALVTAAAGATNANNYYAGGSTTFGAITAGAETLNFTLGSGATLSVALNATNAGSASAAVNAINAVTGASGIYAVADNSGKISLQGSSNFSVTDTTNAAFAGGGVFGSAASTAAAAQTVNAPTAQASGANGQSAITAIDAAVKALGLVQGVVGAGENKLQYAISLAQSQISSFSSAQSQIRDADVASAAANLTKSQVLQQTSIAAMAQANQEPQSILKLLQ
jgi:flagellin